MGILAFDFGGSAVKYGYWELETLTHKGQFTTPATWIEMKAQLSSVFQQLSQEVAINGVAFSAPGVVNSQRQVIEGISAIPYIHGFDIYTELEELFGLPVAMENDANCAGMAEFYEGAARGYQNVAFVVIGTGVGGAMFTNGELNKGAHLYGGEFGLMFLNGEHTFSTLGTAVQMAWRYCERKGLDKNTFSGKEVFELAENGDPLAQEEVESFYDYLTKGLFSIQFSFDPEVIVLGGGISAKEGLLTEINQRMKKLTSHFGLNDFDPLITLCEYRNDANLIGAAANYLAQQEAGK
ncbi:MULTISPECIES: ROK family protein [Enterococcus]|uniref:N-acetylmannosamine kinase n=1 Tax=Enterococcus mundtii TaxID=53346 RepID=A0A1L8UY36_ENTMU|nr:MULTISPECIES: ROK family protein [Enterococcus]GEN18440.1 N-acetylmannosamine kinase [Ligilactobacillus acidipiscis]AUB53234.1 N-acetylmannosamine kinase [Enterococcus mundtii]MZZ59450.1 ROK family protein [Enterococcus mundtii]MZZ62521.1 ROK family protein [Enterococcus mundtii]MZZ69528.1 ROK family protein [Enterococcus mundtii]